MDSSQFLKVVLLGDSGVGKTCLRSQFVHHVFTNAYKATIGGDYLTTTVNIPKDSIPKSNASLSSDTERRSQSTATTTTKVNLQVWDTAGQERFNSISQAFYRGADVCILVYDVTNYESVLSIRDWFSRFMEHCRVDKPGVIIVGNKIDRVNDRCIDKDEIREVLCRNNPKINLDDYITNWDTDLIEISSKQLSLVESVFERAAHIGVQLPSGRRQSIAGFESIELKKLRRSSCAC
ncbi:hypothetical protein FT663_01876 [Candidozyma haemuli var. vulneris]|uniref:Uncharacterized protein n=1 Tax=Candidozyma haemuli TaxID=45357 RepID=A0A2V1AN25_9ASCO|nr:hypothetical protein CXQ85_003316 [[Candida] haemuloni]KAF3993372.1 hypothetical protein FT663_01876 [[Candida] haemuloni var. vulneris]KAF3993829.1 hypothetical protein FT662_00277 [[Candida] haemuloni var. vulneris]PVH19470.1 hypothetical protein CXQ85_003316 [[Candida] haemuloni]